VIGLTGDQAALLGRIDSPAKAADALFRLGAHPLWVSSRRGFSGTGTDPVQQLALSWLSPPWVEWAKGQSESASDSATDQPVVRAEPSKPVILIAEDDPDQRSILELVLTGAGYDVDFAFDGEMALEKLRIALPDLLIVDLMMPRIDGAELVRRLRSDPRFAMLPLLVLTVVSDQDREFELLALGADDYCEKSMQRKILLQRIENLIKRSESRKNGRRSGGLGADTIQ
jgi:CheY-like chemotaxis protein